MLQRARARALSPELRRELEEGPTWSYEWELARGVRTPVHRSWLPELYGTTARMIEGPVREALAAAGGSPAALDIACNEGWFAHRLLEWGAGRVVAVDSRAVNIRRARLVRDQLGIAPERLELIERDLFDIDPGRDGRFEVVALLGILYHLENPVGAMRLARSLTRSLCVIESQVAPLAEPLAWSDPEGNVTRSRAAFALHREADEETKLSPLAAMPGVVSLIPSQAAIAELALAAGFASVEVLEPPAGSGQEHLRGNRAVVLARCR